TQIAVPPGADLHDALTSALRATRYDVGPRRRPESAQALLIFEQAVRQRVPELVDRLAEHVGRVVVFPSAAGGGALVDEPRYPRRDRRVRQHDVTCFDVRGSRVEA